MVTVWLWCSAKISGKVLIQMLLQGTWSTQCRLFCYSVIFAKKVTQCIVLAKHSLPFLFHISEPVLSNFCYNFDISPHSAWLSPRSLTWLFTRLSQSFPGQFVRQEVEAVARYVPQGQSRPSSEEASESVLLQDDGDAVNRPSVALRRPLALQPHLHQVYGCADRHLKAGSGGGLENCSNGD